MKTGNRAPQWILAAATLVLGCLATFSGRLPQGKGIWRADFLEGTTARVFGVGLIAIGIYFVFILLKKKSASPHERSDQ